jgi:hypothetical protein
MLHLKFNGSGKNVFKMGRHTGSIGDNQTPLITDVLKGVVKFNVEQIVMHNHDRIHVGRECYPRVSLEARLNGTENCKCYNFE